MTRSDDDVAASWTRSSPCWATPRRTLLCRTDRGDVLTLTPSPCGFLFLDRRGEGHWRIPVALDELG